MGFRQRINLADKFYLALQEVNPAVTYLTDWEVRGEISPDVFRAAWVATLNRLPALKSVVRGRQGWFGRLWWEELDSDGADLFEYIDCFQDGQRSLQESETRYQAAYEEASHTFWDIRKTPPCKARLVRRGQDHWSLFFLFHHAVADGPAAVTVLQVFAETYGLLLEGQPVPGGPIPQATRSYRRFLLKTPPWKLISTFLAYVRYERMNRPRATTPFVSEWKQLHGTIRAVDLVLEKAQVGKLLRRVRELGITLNEAMILACVRTVYRWLVNQGRWPEKISIAVPVNLRPLVGLLPVESVANYGVTMNINVSASVVTNPSRLIDAIRFQSDCLKRRRFPVVWMLQAALYLWLPLRVLKRIMLRSIESGKAAQNTATLVYSNVGRVFVDERGEPAPVRLGPRARVEGFRFSNPIAYPIAASMATITYGGRMLVSLSYLEPVLEKPAMERFLQEFQRALFDVMDEESLTKKRLPPFAELAE